MKFELYFQIETADGAWVDATVSQEVIDTVYSVHTAYEWAWQTVKSQRWVNASSWVLKIDDKAVHLPQWVVKVATTSIPSGFSLEENFETTYSWIIKPFVGFDLSEINLIEREWEAGNELIAEEIVSPDNRGSLYTPEYDAVYPMVELRTYLEAFNLK
jgi:hypothetical protein